MATVIAMVSIVTGFNNNMVRNFQSFGASLVMVQKYEPRFGPGGPRPEGELRRKDLTLADAAAIREQVPEARAVSPQRYLWDNLNFHLKYRDNEVQSPQGLRRHGAVRRRDEPLRVQGRFLNELDVEHAADVIVLGSEIAEKIFPAGGSAPEARDARPRQPTPSSASSRRRARCSASPRTTSSRFR